MPYENPEGVPCFILGKQDERGEDASDSAAGVLSLKSAAGGILDMGAPAYVVHGPNPNAQL